MKKGNINIALITAGLFFMLLQSASAQIPINTFTDSIADIEKKSFQIFSTDGRISAASNYTRTLASNNFDVNFYRCEWKVDPTIRLIAGKVTSYFTVTESTNNIIYDLSDTLTVDSITYRGNQISFQRLAGDGLQIQFPFTLNTGQKDSVSIYYQGVPRDFVTYKPFLQSSHNGTPVISTLSEPFGAKEWWPCKNGLSDKADSIDIIITCPDTFTGTTNGLLTNTQLVGGKKIVSFKHRYPIASYLVCMAVTNYVTDIDSVQIGTKTVPLIMNSYPENEDYFKYATYVAKQSIVKFSELFGEYPFAKEHYSQTQAILSGGMEHQTNTFISSNWNQLIAHELGHHWFGDNVTCGSWQHTWLNEGFANYMQFIYVQNFDTSLIVAHLQYYLNLITSQPGGSVFVTDSTDAKRIFDGRLTYAKGGYVVHMLRGILGDSVFFKALRQYLNDPIVKNKFATTADLERNIEQVSGKNLQSFFQKWIYGEGYANYNCTWTQNTNNWAKVQINQTTSSPTSVSFYEMPVQLRFRNSKIDTIITVNNQKNGETFWINVGFQADTMMVDPNYWILAKNRIVQKISPQSIVVNDMKIYPNPAPDHLVVSLFNPTSSRLSLRLYNAVGQLVYTTQKDLNGQDENISISTSQFARGLYVLKIYDNNGLIAVKKIIK